MTENEKLTLLESFQKTFWDNSSESHALLTLAESYLAVGRTEQAIDLLQRLIEKDEKNPAWHSRLADILLDTKRFEEAALKYAHAAQYDSDNKLDACHHALEVLWQIEEESLQEARAVALNIHSRFPNDPDFKAELGRLYWRCGEFLEGRGIYEDLLRQPNLMPDRKADLQLSLAGIFEETGEYQKAVELLESSIPNLGSEYDLNEIQIRLAENYVRLGRFEIALEIYLEQAARCIPGKHRAKRLQGAARCYEGMRNYNSAIECLVEILTFIRETTADDDDDWAAKNCVIDNPILFEHIYAALTRCYESQNDFVRAKETFKKEKEYYAKRIARESTKSNHSV